MSRWTKKETESFRTKWLRERMGHRWSGPEVAGPTVCLLCGTKFSAKSSVLLHRRACPKRRKPNRWRVHLNRALTAAQHERTQPVTRDARWILSQIAELERSARLQLYDSGDHATHRPIADEGRWWKFSRDARRYRKLLSLWWATPATARAPQDERYHDRWAAGFTRGRNRLLAKARQTQQRQIIDGGCVYTLAATAEYEGRPIFTEVAG